jgi:acyl-coenzyme A thioesterase PaaI-like protein
MALQIPPNCDLTLGLVCVEKSAPGTTVWQMRVDERFLNPAGIVQGGFISAMLDSAMGVSFLRSVRAGDRLTCTATVLKPGSVVSFVAARVVDDEGRLVATASSIYLIKDRTE